VLSTNATSYFSLGACFPYISFFFLFFHKSFLTVTALLLLNIADSTFGGGSPRFLFLGLLSVDRIFEFWVTIRAFNINMHSATISGEKKLEIISFLWIHLTRLLSNHVSIANAPTKGFETKFVQGPQENLSLLPVDLRCRRVSEDQDSCIRPIFMARGKTVSLRSIYHLAVLILHFEAPSAPWFYSSSPLWFCVLVRHKKTTPSENTCIDTPLSASSSFRASFSALGNAISELENLCFFSECFF
jgi:hypothetical protein